MQCGPYLTPLLSGPMFNVALLSRAARLRAFALCFVISAVVSWWKKLAKVRNNFQALSEFDCC